VHIQYFAQRCFFIVDNFGGSGRVGSRVGRLWVGSDLGLKSDPCPSLH